MWSKDVVEWTEEKHAYLSVVFTWDLQKAYQRAVWLGMQGYTVHAGGPAVKLMPEFLVDVAEIGADDGAVVQRHNPEATFTSRGCIRKCSFCAVPRIEGDLVELEDWPVRRIVCDNNLLACSRKHFDRVIDKLKPLRDIDFEQGLDARLLTQHHAERLAELDCTVRLAFDHVSCEAAVLRAFELLRGVGLGKARIKCYVLLGFRDTPEDTLYRLELIKSLGLRPNPMRYQRLDALARDSYVAPNWTERELKRYMRYWARQRWLEHIPFEEYVG